MTVLLDLTDKILPEGRVKVPRRAAAPRAPVTVNGVAIGEDAIRAEAQNHPSDTPGGALMAAARALAVRELLVQEARASGIAAEAETLGAGLRETDEDALIRALLAGAISTPTAGEAECRRYYRNNPGKFRSETIYEARHILFAARPEEADARRDARAGAERAIAVLAAHPERFAELALMHSACPSRHQGGSLGQLTRGSTVPEFEAMLSTLADGQLSPAPAETRFGCHVIRLDRTIPGATLPFEQVAGRIAAGLRAASWRRAAAQYIGILAGRARIEGIDLAGSDGPLVR